jgi:hypothetical protein
VVTLRAFEALFAGFAVTVLLSLVTAALVKALAPDWANPTRPMTVGAIFAHLGASFLAAAGGGYVTAWMAANVLPYVLALGVIVLVFSGFSALPQRGKLPIPYLLVSVALGPLGVFVGGLVRLRVEGIL